MTQPNEEANVNGTTSNEGTKLSYEELEAELRKVRNEAASRRITNRDLEQQAQKWREYEESQKTELQKLQDQLAERDRKLSEFATDNLRRSVASEFGLANEDIDFLTGSDEATIRAQAEKLKARLGTKVETSRPADLLAGNRGTPIGSGTDSNNIDDLIRRMAGR